MAKLIIKDPKGNESIHELKDDVTTFGRASTNIIQVKDEKASREHCRIVKDGDSFRLEDTGSRNGVTVNGMNVKSQTLKVGDVLEIGDWKFIFDQEVSVGAEELFSTVGVDAVEEKDDETKHPDEAAAGQEEDSRPERYVLLVTSGPDKGKQVEVGDEKVTIGRHSSNVLALSDESSSNYHAEIAKEAIGHVVVDLGSTNGTLVNGQKEVKSPLAHGTEIKIGQTTMVFKDINRQVDEEAVFGTVVLDTAQLEEELTTAQKGAGVAVFGRIAAAVLLLGALLGVGYLVYAGVCRLLSESYEPPEGTLITRNFSFDGETGLTGAPKGWEWDASRHLTWEMTPEGDCFENNPSKGMLVLRRSSQANYAAYTECRYSDPITVTGGTALRVGTRIRTENAAGTFGIAVHYRGPENLTDTDYVSLWGPHPVWNKLEQTVIVPRWANQVRFALYGAGNQGRIFYDHVFCVPEGPATGEREETIAGSGVQAYITPGGVVFARIKGAMAVYRAEITAVNQGKVRSVQSLGRARGLSRSGDEITARGNFPEWAALVWMAYTVRLYPARYGVGLDVEVSSDNEVAVDELLYILEVGGQFGLEDPEIHMPTRPLAFQPNQKMRSVKEVVFNGVRKDTLAISFPNQTRTIRINRRGRKFILEIFLLENGFVRPEGVAASIELNTRSALEEQRLSSLEESLNAALGNGTAADAKSVLNELEQNFGNRQEIAKLVEHRRIALKARFDTEKIRASALLSALRNARTPDARVSARTELEKFLEQARSYWAGTEEEQAFIEAASELEQITGRWAAEEEEKEAQEWLNKAYRMLDARAYPVALSYVDNLLEKFPDSKAAQKARDSNLKDVIQRAISRKERERTFVERILKEVDNWERNGKYAKALRIIEQDPLYPLFKENPTIKAKIENLRKKLGSGEDTGG